LNLPIFHPLKYFCPKYIRGSLAATAAMRIILSHDSQSQ
jgi:hypothetical protein